MGTIVERNEIAPLLGSTRRSGQWLLAFCPVPSHGDGGKHNMRAGQTLMLSDRGVLKCGAGCSFADIMNSLRAGGPKAPSSSTPPRRIGVSRTSVKTPSPSSLPSDAPTDVRPTVSTDDWCQVDMYQYRTQAGELVAEKSRWHNLSQVTAEGKPTKKFLWRLPGAVGWTGLAGKLTTKDLPLFGIERLTQ